MYQIAYLSTARATTTQEDLADILNVALLFNRAAGITGLLVAGSQRFLQVIEGPDRAVHQLFATIRRDRRHFGIVTLSQRAVEQREFGDWSMGYLAGGDARLADDLRQTIDALVDPISDPGLRAQFRGFIDMHVRAA